MPVLKAALLVRDEAGRSTDLRDLFHRVGSHFAQRMFFEAEMIVPPQAIDDLGQVANATATFVRYKLELGWRATAIGDDRGSLEILHEELSYITRSDPETRLGFKPSASWRQSVLIGSRAGSFISTVSEGNVRKIRLHQDKGRGSDPTKRGGRTYDRLATELPRTVLSVANATESPTALCARREMQSWRLLQLEPSALRRPDEFHAPAQLAPSGLHLPATLYRLAHKQTSTGAGVEVADPQRIYTQVTNRLADLIEDIRDVWVDRDEKRELLTLMVRGRDGTVHPARALSDGTLRFLALAILELDSSARGMLCLEEPENGIHPQRVPAMLRLLQDIAVDTSMEVDSSNLLRQVIINTHSPVVVAETPHSSLLVADLYETSIEGALCRSVRFRSLPKTWRAEGEKSVSSSVAPGDILAYLNPVAPPDPSLKEGPRAESRAQKLLDPSLRVADRPDLQLLLPLPSPEPRV